MKYLAIDIGASSGRHILGWLEGGKLRTEEIYRFPNGAKEKDGKLVWDADALFAEILNGLKRAAELGKTPDCVGVDTWAVDYALLDEKDHRIGDVYCYRDKRGQAAATEAHKVMDFASLYAKTGIQYQPFNTLYQLFDDKKTGKLSGAKSFLMLPDYFHFLLTGVKRQEYTNATSTGMVNAITHTWDEDILAAFGFDKSLFGALAAPGSTVGSFRKEIQAAVGYNATVILPATHDTASAVLAAPIEKGAPYISSGTWSLLGVEQTAAHTDPISMKYNYSNEGSLHCTFRFQKNIMGLWMIQQVRHELGDAYSFAELADIARRSPTDALVDVNSTRYLAPKSMIAAIKEEAGDLSVGELAYCIFNSLAASYKRAIDEMEELTGRGYDTLHIIGGGSQNILLNELTALKTGKRVLTGPTECTAIGNIVAQMMGAGEVKDLKEARNIIKNTFDIKEVVL